MKCTKTVAPELLLLAQICTKSFVGWGFAPDPTGELIALPRPRSWFRGGTPGKEKGEGREREGRGRWDWDQSHLPTKLRARKWRERWGWEGREGEGKAAEGRERIHGLKLVAPPMHKCISNSQSGGENLYL